MGIKRGVVVVVVVGGVDFGQRTWKSGAGERERVFDAIDDARAERAMSYRRNAGIALSLFLKVLLLLLLFIKEKSRS